MSLTKFLPVALFASLFFGRDGLAQPAIKLEIPQRTLPVRLLVDSGGSASLLLEHSSDLAAWHPWLNVFLKTRSRQVSDRSTFDRLPSPRFYRAISPAQSIDQMLERWRSNGFRKYTYRFQRTCFCFPGPLSATVTVEDGKVIAVTEARSNELANTNPDLSQFKSIEELFVIVKDGSTRADFLAVEFDPVLQFPAFIDLDYYVGAADDEIQYEASDVRPIP